jgi:hypothetical protein
MQKIHDILRHRDEIGILPAPIMENPCRRPLNGFSDTIWELTPIALANPAHTSTMGSSVPCMISVGGSGRFSASMAENNLAPGRARKSDGLEFVG